MATPTYVPLATLTLSSASATVTFSSIPATFRDLIFVSEYTKTASGKGVLRFNSDSGSNYSFVQTFNASSSSATISSIRLADVSTSRGLDILQIMDYSQTDKHKTVLQRENEGTDFVVMVANRYASTTAISTITVSTSSGSFNIGSTFSLFGIA